MPKETVELDRPVIPITDAERAARFVGDPVSVEGTAVNADACACIELPDVIIHCPELPQWPDDVVGQRISATGTLQLRGEGEPPAYDLHEARYQTDEPEPETPRLDDD